MLNNNKIIVSVIIPCFKQAQYLPDALDSVLAQTYSDWECIIVNDGSPDNTKEIALEWISRDSRFKYLEQENSGVADARNNGINKSSGNYILPLDADDKIGPQYLELALIEFKIDPKTKLVYCEAEYFGAKTGKWELPPYSYRTLLEDNMIFCSALFRRDDFEKTNGYSTKLTFGLEDWNFWLDLLNHDDKVVRLTGTHFYYRIVSDSRTRTMVLQRKTIMKNIIFSNHHNIYSVYGISAIDSISAQNKYDNLKKSITYKIAAKISHLLSILKINDLFGRYN